MMSQEAGSNPPQETGLMTNSWYGKFHLEMRWHHSFHFFLWGREKLAQRAEQYFADVRDPARAFTRDKQGYAGVRWPKMVAPPEFMTWTGLPSPQGQEEDHEDEEEEEGGATSSGDDDDDNTFFWYDGPSGAGPWILWQQPHPISFAEMAYRNAPTAGTVARYNRTVHDSADFMADFILRNNAIDNFQRDGDGSGGRGGEQAACYSLGPPMFTAEIESFEGKPATAAKDGTFENVYWHFGLTVANNWRARLQLPPEPRWVEAVEKLCAPVPRALNMTGPRIYYPYSGVGFTEAFAPGYAVQLFANALVPGAAHGLDELIGQKDYFVDEFGLIKKYSDRFLLCNNLGDITNVDVLSYYYDFFKNNKRDIVTSDCGLSGEYGQKKEKIMTKIFFCQFISGISVLKKGGNFFMKYYHVSSNFNISLIYLMTLLFNEVKFIKPESSRQISGEEIYLLLLDYKLEDNESENIFLKLKNIISQDIDTSKSLISFTKINKKILSNIYENLSKYYKNKLKLKKERKDLIDELIDFEDDYNSIKERKLEIKEKTDIFVKNYVNKYFKRMKYTRIRTEDKL